MRPQVRGSSAYLVNRYQANGRDVTAEDIDTALNADENDPQQQAILDSTVRHAGSLRGTRPYWAGRRRNLEAYVRALGKPTLFVTCSAANLQWDWTLLCD